MWCVEVGKEHRDEDGRGRGGPEPGIGCWGLGPLSYRYRQPMEAISS